ncbi:metallophosphoesterase family protein [Limnoglobus roseus]|uniref:Metallophosphoesterase n=1 Tax=Limnoglobus roseus TaxID=2598579 RepID=A0A5C1A9M4_9BACT|nr:metallophosphoesterase family protein [Limnoglobus roseus]QEL14512.1 metallophosphoesterase [Limnoglobus roseus]
MLIGILSDTHDEFERTRRAVALLASRGAKALIHCGDLIEPEIVPICAVLPFYFVFGNNDADVVPQLRSIAKFMKATCLEWGGLIELAGKHIAVTHGHMGTDVRRLSRPSPDYFLSGHSHVAMDVRNGACRCINPGALHRADEYTVALLNLETDVLEFLKV